MEYIKNTLNSFYILSECDGPYLRYGLSIIDNNRDGQIRIENDETSSVNFVIRVLTILPLYNLSKVLGKDMGLTGRKGSLEE